MSYGIKCIAVSVRDIGEVGAIQTERGFEKWISDNGYLESDQSNLKRFSTLNDAFRWKSQNQTDAPPRWYWIVEELS